MPKIIEGVRENILDTAKHMLFTEEYNNLSIRNVAKACGIATGTIYNYFENKEVLIASVMVQDWKIALEKMDKAVADSISVWSGMHGIQKAITEFIDIYESVWHQSAKSGAAVITQERHRYLCEQIGAIVEQLLCRHGYEKKKHFSVFLAENVLSSSIRTYLLPQFKEMVETVFPPKGGENE